jgi:hypothetical protein
MKTIKADLLADIVSSYDQTKTTIQGRVAQKTINARQILSPPLTKFLDFFTDTSGSVPTATMFPSPNGRLFIAGTVSAGVIPIFLYDFDYATGVSSYVGRINMTSPNTAATTHTIKSIKAVDTGTTGWKIMIVTTASVTINGGLFILNDIAKADFTPIGTTIPFATGNAQKAVYFAQDPANIGAGQLNILSVGSTLDTVASKLYVHNGIAATHQYYVYDYSVALNYISDSVAVSVASPGIIAHAGHSFVANTPVVFTAGTLPTGLTVGTVYFVKNPIAGVSYELSATSGGASINTTGSPSVGAIIGRAFGTSSDSFLFKTGNLPALTGTLLSTDSENKAVPVSAPINGGVLNGNSCVFFATTSNLYLGLLSELTVGVTTWPSLTTSNILGATNQVTAPSAINASWFNSLDHALYVTNTTRFIGKKVENNVILQNFGELHNNYYETVLSDQVKLGLTTIVNFANESGWLFVMGGTVGQRGIICMDLRSDSLYDYSYVVSKVLDTPNSQIKGLCALRENFFNSANPVCYYRTSGFGSISGGWTLINMSADLSAIATAAQIQFKMAFSTASQDRSRFAQVYEILLTLESNEEISDNWEYSHDKSSNVSPTRCAFRLKKAYATSVPTIHFRAYDLAASLLINHNTSANAANFEYSTDGGTVWLPLGTIPNTVGTLIRYNFTSGPGVDIRPSIKES